MGKYKINKKFNKLNSITISLIVILFSMTIGYSLWTDYQKVIGKIKARYIEPKIENIQIDDDSNFNDGDQVYISKVEDYGWGGSDKIDFLDSSIVETVNANTNRLELIGNYDISTGWTALSRDVTFSFYVKNNNPVPMTSGGFTFLEKTIKYEPSFHMPSEIAADDYGELKITLDLPGSTNYDWGKIAYKFHYKVGEVTRYAYVTIDLKKI